MYGVQPPRRRVRPWTLATVEIVMAVKAGLLLIYGGMVGLGLVVTVFNRGPGDVELWMVAAFLLMVPFGTLYLITAVQAGKGRDWARITAIVLESLALVGAPFAVARSEGIITFVLFLSMAVSIAVIGCATHGSAYRYCRAV